MKPCNEIRSAQFLDTYFPIVDGVVQTVHNYATIMNRSSYCCVVVPQARTPYDDGQLPYDVLRCKAAQIPHWEYCMPMPAQDHKMRDTLISKKPDIFHAHSPICMGPYAGRLARKLGIPIVSTFHSKYYDDVLRITKSKALARAITNSIVKFYESVDSVWAVSHGTAETLYSYGYKGDIFVINNGTHFTVPEHPEALKKEAAETFHLPSDKHILLFVGHQIWQKNLRVVLDTFRLLCNEGNDYCLVIVGNGYHEKQIQDYAASLNLPEGSVLFPGRIVDQKLLSGMLLCGDLFFFPSIYDNAPLVVREAAIMGLPSLLAAGSNAAESVEHNVSGFTAEANAEAMKTEIQRIFSTPGLLEKVGAEARRTIPVSWEDLIPQVYAKYGEIIEKKQLSEK